MAIFAVGDERCLARVGVGLAWDPLGDTGSDILQNAERRPGSRDRQRAALSSAGGRGYSTPKKLINSVPSQRRSRA
jgi:hypothetical protein